MTTWFDRLIAYCEKVGSTRQIVRDEGNGPVLYLKRHYIYRCNSFEVMLHQFYRSDTGDLHNHPAASFGRILNKGYWEHLCNMLVTGYDPFGQHKIYRGPGFFKWSYRPASDKKHINARSYHKVELNPEDIDTGEVKTLFVMLKRNENRWAFWQNGNPIDFEEKFRQDGTLDKQSRPEKWGMGWFPKQMT